MQQSGVSTPILGETSLLILAGGVGVLLLAAGAAFTILFYRDPTKVQAFRGGRILHYATIFTVVFATIVLSIEGILSGEAVASILGGIIGYVLGTLKAETTRYPSQTADNYRTSNKAADCDEPEDS
jgi:hypothetical protein